jgi:formylglycine-generating enzyme required for sulfatase activity
VAWAEGLKAAWWWGEDIAADLARERAEQQEGTSSKKGRRKDQSRRLDNGCPAQTGLYDMCGGAKKHTQLRHISGRPFDSMSLTVTQMWYRSSGLCCTR